MIKIGALLKLTTSNEAIVYKIIGEETTAIKVFEFCKISRGKMLLNYGQKSESYIYRSDIGMTYKEVKYDEVNKIIEVLSNSLKEVGF